MKIAQSSFSAWSHFRGFAGRKINIPYLIYIYIYINTPVCKKSDILYVYL